MTSEAWSAGCARSSRSSSKPSAPGIRRSSPPSRVHCNGSHAPSGRDRCHPNPRRRLPLPANLQTAAASVNRNEVFDVFESRAVRLSRVVGASQPPATRFRWCPAESRWPSAPHPPGRSLCAEHPSTSHTSILRTATEQDTDARNKEATSIAVLDPAQQPRHSGPSIQRELLGRPQSRVLLSLTGRSAHPARPTRQLGS